LPLVNSRLITLTRLSVLVTVPLLSVVDRPEAFAGGIVVRALLRLCCGRHSGEQCGDHGRPGQASSPRKEFGEIEQALLGFAVIDRSKRHSKRHRLAPSR
jgi:hypothetical protein